MKNILESLQNSGVLVGYVFRKPNIHGPPALGMMNKKIPLGNEGIDIYVKDTSNNSKRFCCPI
jgi:hypothetical protein